MDDDSITHDDLIKLTRYQARQIDELRAEVERLRFDPGRVPVVGNRADRGADEFVMPPLLPRFTVKRLMVSVAIVAVVLGAIKVVRSFWDALDMFPVGTVSESVGPSRARDAVVACLSSWGVADVPGGENDYQAQERLISRQVRGIRGFTEHDTFHGDGTDWYEVEVSPELAAELRDSLAKSGTVTKTSELPSDIHAPPWWPKQWPVGAQFYEKDHRYLMVPDTGTRVWLMFWQS